MAVKIRLARRGRKKQAIYDVVIADVRAPRDGRFIEKIGIYNPNTNPATINIDNEKAFQWVMNGAQPTDTVKAMLSYRGVLMRKHLQIGVIKGAVTQEDADKKYADWLAEKESKITGKVEQLANAKGDAKKAKLEAEAKVNTARAEALAAKKAELAAANAPVVEAPEAVVEETPAVEEVATPEAVVEKTPAVEEVATPEAVVEETPAVEEVATPEAVVEETPAVEEVAAPEAVVEEAPAVEEVATPEATVEATPVAEAPATDATEEEKKAD
ncbi:MAG: small subunit ribosomal protein S16 [Roseivirga sp.]|jgi:small subunit ribosomal protein S16